MMKSQRIYIDYEDYPVFEDEYTSNEFGSGVQNEVNQIITYNWLVAQPSDIAKLVALAYALSYPIYREYSTDRLAYEDKDVFLKRVCNSIANKLNKWYLQKKIQEDLISNATLDNFISNGGTTSNTSENASTGSAVIQKSASTPTGISHNAQSETIDVELSHEEEQDKTSMEITDGYADKYTNFVGKTNGLHRNEVERDTEIQRKSNYGLALEILEKIPYSYINEVLTEVSQHFIQIY